MPVIGSATALILRMHEGMYVVAAIAGQVKPDPELPAPKIPLPAHRPVIVHRPAGSGDIAGHVCLDGTSLAA